MRVNPPTAEVLDAEWVKKLRIRKAPFAGPGELGGRQGKF
jgi:hypothetical protein